MTCDSRLPGGGRRWMRFNFQPTVCMKFLSTRLFVLTLAGVCFGALPAAAQPVQHLSTTQPGGMPGLPVMGGISKLTNGVQIIWDGPSAVSYTHLTLPTKRI